MVVNYDEVKTMALPSNTYCGVEVRRLKLRRRRKSEAQVLTILSVEKMVLEEEAQRCDPGPAT
ncbi:hypothetical protein P7K49_000370, partial [Saguinus oedipus]